MSNAALAEPPAETIPAEIAKVKKTPPRATAESMEAK